MKATARPRLPLVGIAASAVTGILAARYSGLGSGWFLVAAAAALPFSIFRRGTTLALCVFSAGAFGAAHVWQSRDNPARVWAESVVHSQGVVRAAGVVIDSPRELGPGVWSAPLRTDHWVVDGDGVKQRSTVMARWRTDQAPAYGDRWEIDGTVQTPGSPRNPGEFDAAAHYAKQGIFLELRGRGKDDARLIGHGEASPIKSAALASRAWMLDTLGLGLAEAPAIRALVAGITMGAHETEADQFADAFRQTGTFHLFSIR